MQNYVSIHEALTRPNPAFAAVHGQAALLLRYDVPIYYVSRELLAACVGTELRDDTVFEAIPFPFDALVFMLPKETCVTLLLIMVSSENLIEHGRLGKKRKLKSDEEKPTEFWSPDFLGRLYQSSIANEVGNRGASTQRLNWFVWRLKIYSMTVFLGLTRQNCTRANVRRCSSTFMRTTLVQGSVLTRQRRELPGAKTKTLRPRQQQQNQPTQSQINEN